MADVVLLHFHAEMRIHDVLSVGRFDAEDVHHGRVAPVVGHEEEGGDGVLLTLAVESPDTVPYDSNLAVPADEKNPQIVHDAPDAFAGLGDRGYKLHLSFARVPTD